MSLRKKVAVSSAKKASNKHLRCATPENVSSFTFRITEAQVTGPSLKLFPIYRVLLYNTRSDLKVGASRRCMLVRERISNQELLR